MHNPGLARRTAGSEEKGSEGEGVWKEGGMGYSHRG